LYNDSILLSLSVIVSNFCDWIIVGTIPQYQYTFYTHSNIYSNMSQDYQEYEKRNEMYLHQCLEYVQRFPGRRIIIFILYYDDSSYTCVEKNYASVIGRWACPLFIHTTVYLESIMYRCYFRHYQDLLMEKTDFVGTIGYKCIFKTNLPPIDMLMELSDSDPSSPYHLNFDIFAFLPLFQNSKLSLLQQANQHPHFVSLWTTLLSHLGYEKKDYTSSQIVKFFCNYWMCRTSWMFKYIDFLQLIFEKMERMTETGEENRHFQEQLWSDSKYKASYLDRPEVQKAMKNNYITHHCFLLERLPCFFFWVKKASIIYDVPPVLWTRFDSQYYVKHSADLRFLAKNVQKLRNHFKRHGCSERRPFHPLYTYTTS